MITFVYRSHVHGALSKRVRRLPASSIVTWFAERMVQAANDPVLGSEDTLGQESAFIEALWTELGGSVYGLASIFTAAKERRFEPPCDMAGLRTLLREHLYVEGGPENIQVDEHSVRVLTDDDEVELAYFFFDDEALARAPHHLAWLVHEEPSLPTEVGDQGLSIDNVRALTPAGRGAGTTYVCLFTFYDGESLPGQVVKFEGVRLPDLAGHLCSTIPDAEPESWSAKYMNTWPLELRLLRAMLDEGEVLLAPALERTNRYPIETVGSLENHTHAGIGPHAAARDEFAALANARTDSGDRSRSIIFESAHAVLFAMHVHDYSGYQQWILFDDLWAGSHPHLATSLIRYGKTWDPLSSTNG